MAADIELAAVPPATAAPDIEAWLGEVARVGLGAEIIAEAMVEDGMPAARAQVLAAAAVIRHGPLSLQDLLADERGREAAVLLRRWAGEASLPSPAPDIAVHHLLDPAALPSNRLVLPDRSVEVLMTAISPPMALLGNLLSADECATLIELARLRLRPDTVVDNASEAGASILIGEVRSSYGCSIRDDEHPLMPVLQARLTALLGGARGQRETLVLSRYLPGQQFKPHVDYFGPDRAGYARLVEDRGQRVATLVIYLSDTEGGGGTLFPEAGIEVRPQRGAATYFSYQRSDGNPDPASLHAGAPVLCGEKWIATVWLRERTAA